MAKQEFHLDFCGRGITVETGEIAKQADGAVIIVMEIQLHYQLHVHRTRQKKGLTFSL